MQVHLSFQLSNMRCEISQFVLAVFDARVSVFQVCDKVMLSYKKITKKWFLSNTSPYPLKDNTSTKLAFKVGPSSARQQNAI